MADQLPPVSGNTAAHTASQSAAPITSSMGHHIVCAEKVPDGFAGLSGKMSPQLNSKGKTFTPGSPVQTTVQFSGGTCTKKTA